MAYLTNKATRLIKRRGTQAMILKYAGYTADSFGGTKDKTRTEHSCFVLFSNLKNVAEIMGGGFQSVSKVVVLISMEGLDFAPTTHDKIRVGDIDLGIENIERFAPAGETHFYKAEVSGW